MTTATARAVPLRLPEAPPATRALPSARDLLRLVPQRRSQAAKMPFAVVLVVLLGGGLLGLLLLNTLVAQGSFTLHDLSAQARALQQQEQQLASEVQARQAPADLAARATALGMVPGGAPAFLRLSDGRVLGAPSAGRPSPKPVTPPAPAKAVKAPAAPSGSTTWTAPRQTAPPTTSGGHG